MNNTPPPKPDDRFLAMLRQWRKRELEIVEGKVLPSHLDRTRGHSPLSQSALLDLRQMIDVELERDMLPEQLRVALEHCHAVPTASAIFAAAETIPADLQGDGFEHLRAALIWHSAMRAHRPAVTELLAVTLQSDYRQNPIAWVQSLSLVTGLVLSGTNEDLTDELEAVDVEEAREKGLARLDKMVDLVVQVNLALDAVNSEEDAAVEASPAFQSALAAMKAAQAKREAEEKSATDCANHLTVVLEDRAEIVRDHGLVVVRATPGEKPLAARADIVKSMKAVVGKELPLVGLNRLAAARASLQARYPHLNDVIDRALATQSPLPHLRFNLLFVSPPGLGKTTFARDLLDALGVPHVTYACGGSSDASFGGTSAQWNNSRCSIPLQLIGRSKVGNPGVILDEVDKIALSRHNGNLSDVLLGFLEPSSSMAYFDLALEQDVNLSAISYVATANNLEDVPAALRDRFRVIQVPEPGWQHIGALSEQILNDIAKDRGLDRRWLEPLAPDEVDVIKAAWPGGSLRKLQRAVSVLVDGREQLMGRA